MNRQTALATRRNFLRGTGVILGLPWLESLGGIAHSAEVGMEPRRLLLICLPLGIYREAFIPRQEGTDYELTEYLTPMADFRIASPLSRPGSSWCWWRACGADAHLYRGSVR